MKGEMGRTCSTNGSDEKCRQSLAGKLKGRAHLQDAGVDTELNTEVKIKE
jgi:hypothetical protein